MKFFQRCRLIFILSVAIFASWLDHCNVTSASTFVRLDYNLFITDHYLSTVFIELFDDRPITRNNFLQYVDGNHYNGTMMHRLVPGFVLQGGGFYEDIIPWPAPLNIAMDEDPVDLDGNPNTDNPMIQNEFNNTPFRTNARGTLAMAKSPTGPNTATNQFFFNLNNNGPNLDNQNGGFTVFARVVGNGMTLIDGLAGLPKLNLNKDIYTQVNNQAHPNYGDIIDDVADGIRDFAGAGAFGDMPFIGNSLLTLDRAKRTDYFSSTSATNVPASHLFLTNTLGHVEAGAAFTGTGKFVVGAGRTLSASHGANIGVSLEVGGTFSPGLSVGSVTINNYRQFAGSTLEIQIGGETAGSQYDQLLVNTTATLTGSLRVTGQSTFVPSAGDTFNIINAASIVGSFSSAFLPTLRTGLAWDLQSTATSVKLVVLPDYNNNGSVDDADLNLWRGNYGSTTNLAADGDGNGRVDGKDFLLWQRYYGQTVTVPPPPAIFAVPEPSALCLLGVGLLSLVARRSRP